MKPRILIVDDDEDARALYGTYLRTRGDWDVVCAENGEQALDLLDSSFHAVVLDEMMPGLKGVQVLQQIRSRPSLKRLCVAMMTANTDLAVTIGTLQHHPNLYLHKAMNTKEDLYAALAQELRKSMNDNPIRPLRAFLSHSHLDKPKIQEICVRLQRDFIEPWLDKESLIAGQDWRLEIEKAVEASDVVVICLSQHVSRPGFLQKEIRHALRVADEQPEGEIFIIPLMLEPCEMPFSLRRLHRIHWWEDGAYERLLEAIQTKQSRRAAGR
jgi:DNA-binding response OmpR family regulator